MIEVELKTTPPATVAYIAMQGPYEQIPQAMGALYGWVTTQGLTPVGMPSGVYLSDPQTVDQEHAEWMLRAPIADDRPACPPDQSGCGIDQIESHLVASAVHKGPYDTVDQTYRELGIWVEQHGLHVAGPPEEYYLTDPDETPPEEYLTEVTLAVARA